MVSSQKSEIFDIAKTLLLLENEVSNFPLPEKPENLYAPMRYILSLGGKRIRPLLTLMTAYMYSDNWEKAMQAAIGIEFFHNYTLMHDDILDKSPLRRGKSTVHKVWNEDIALLSGDAMQTFSFKIITEAPYLQEYLGETVKLLNNSALEICEGQQMDMDFEKRSDVKSEEYLHMIYLKTGVLLGTAMALGAMSVGVKGEELQKVYNIGCGIGISFQLKDDLLDVYGEQEKVGKRKGGDIISNKKTYLLIKALENASEPQKEKLHYWLSIKNFDEAEKVQSVTQIYDIVGVPQLAQNKMLEFFVKSLLILDNVNAPTERKQVVSGFLRELFDREK